MSSSYSSELRNTFDARIFAAARRRYQYCTKDIKNSTMQWDRIALGCSGILGLGEHVQRVEVICLRQNSYFGNERACPVLKVRLAALAFIRSSFRTGYTLRALVPYHSRAFTSFS